MSATEPLAEQATTEPTPIDMLETALISFIMCFVTRPECVRLEITTGRRSVVVDIIVHPADVGRIKGRMINGNNERLELLCDIANEIARRYKMRLSTVDVINARPDEVHAASQPTFQVIDRDTGIAREVAIA